MELPPVHRPPPTLAPPPEEEPAPVREKTAPLVGERIEPPSGKRRRRRRRRKGPIPTGEPGTVAPLVGEPVQPPRGELEATPVSPPPEPMPYVGIPAPEEPARRREARPGEAGAARRRRLSSPRAWYFGPTHWGPRATHTAEEILTPPLKRRRRRKV